MSFWGQTKRVWRVGFQGTVRQVNSWQLSENQAVKESQPHTDPFWQLCCYCTVQFWKVSFRSYQREAERQMEMKGVKNNSKLRFSLILGSFTLGWLFERLQLLNFQSFKRFILTICLFSHYLYAFMKCVSFGNPCSIIPNDTPACFFKRLTNFTPSSLCECALEYLGGSLWINPNGKTQFIFGQYHIFSWSPVLNKKRKKADYQYLSFSASCLQTMGSVTLLSCCHALTAMTDCIFRLKCELK